MSPKQSFIKGTMILLAAGIINRLLGFVPRIALPRVIGAEGVGLYQMGYPLLIVILTFITGGIPLAVAKLVAEAESQGNEARIRNILHTAMSLSVLLGVCFTLLCVTASSWITSLLFTDPRVYYTFVSMSPIITVVAVSAVFRGYFQGRHNMIPTALSQVTETLGRIAAMLILAYILLPYGVEYAAAGAMGGVLIGEICGMSILLYQHYKEKSDLLKIKPLSLPSNPARQPYKSLKPLMSIAFPVTSSKLVGSGSYFLESIMIVQSLAISGVATGVATAQYGALTGMIVPILLLPGALTYSLSTSLVPALSDAAARNDMRTIHKRLHQSLRLALVTGAPFVVIMFMMSEPLCRLLYNNSDISYMLKLMAPVGLLLYFQGPLQATLQALDKPGTALLNTFIGAALKLILIYLLAAKMKWGIIGAVIAINVNITVVTLLHWRSVVELIRFRNPWLDFIKVGASMLCLAALCKWLLELSLPVHYAVHFLIICICCMVVYLFMMLSLKLIDRHDLVRIPWFGPRLQKWI